MKRVLHPILAAYETDDTRLKDALDELDDDFGYAVAGIEKLGRSSKLKYESALTIVNGLSNALSQVIDRIADEIQDIE